MPAGPYLLEVIIADLATDPPTLLHNWGSAGNVMIRWGVYPIPGLIDAGAELEYDSTVYSLKSEKARREQEKRLKTSEY